MDTKKFILAIWNKIKSGALENGKSITPLSIHYEPIIPSTLGWQPSINSMSELLVEIDTKGKYKERNIKAITYALLAFFEASKEFRDAILSESETDIKRKSVQMSNLPQNVADLYYDVLSEFRRDAIKIVNAEPKDFLLLLLECMEKKSKMDKIELMFSEDRAYEMLTRLSAFNIHETELAKIFLSYYKKVELNPISIPTPSTPNLMNPVTFAGWCGEGSIGEAFALYPKTFEDGYVVIKCDNWQSQWHDPKIIEEWSSGVNVVKIKDDTIVLSLDRSKIKKTLVIHNQTVSTSLIGEYIIGLKEAGEFRLEIFYRKIVATDDLIASCLNKDIMLYTREFCCK